jgi:hypothetical protein
MLTQVVVKIMVELLSVLALVSRQIKEGRFSTCNVTYLARRSMCRRNFRKKVVWGERDMDRLPKIGSIDPGEARMTVAQTLGVVRGLLGRVKAVMEGA